MNEIEFQSWKETREKGFFSYFLKHILSYCFLEIVLLSILNFSSEYYSFNDSLRHSFVFSIGIILAQVARWFYHEKRFKEYLKIFNQQ